MNPVRPRVAVVCDYALGYLGGAQTALLQQATALAADGAEVLIISPSPDEVWRRVRPAAAEAAGVDHVSIPTRWTLPGLDLPVLVNNPRLRQRLQAIFTERRIQIVHLQSEFGLAAAAMMVAQEGPAASRIPVVHTVHTFFWRAPSAGQRIAAGLIRWFHRRVTGIEPTDTRLADQPADSALRNMTLAVARRADLVISPSAHQAERLTEAGVEDVAVVPNTVGLPDADPIEAVTGPLKIIWVGRCVPEKRILPFVQAALRAVDRLEPNMINFTVVGDGSQLEEARELAAHCRSIRFLGRLDHERISALLAENHLLALTSRGFDNQPMTVVEAVMALRGVIYCDPALSEGLAGPGIASPASVEALSDVFVDLVRHPERVVDASHAAQTARLVFTPEQHAATVINLYRSLLDGRS